MSSRRHVKIQEGLTASKDKCVSLPHRNPILNTVEEAQPEVGMLAYTMKQAVLVNPHMKKVNCQF
jgi:hypothetical protein